MYEETKKALKKSFEICALLFTIGEKYNQLVNVTKEILVPTEDEVKHIVSNKINITDATIIELKNRYKNAALSIGLSEKHGVALLEYISLLEEMEE